MQWPWSRPERRATSDSYAEQVAAALLDAASGSSDLGQGVATLEVAAGLWSRGFASARVQPNPYGLLTAPVLAWLARELCLSGEAVGLLEVTDGRLMLIPAICDEITGGPSPDTWRYKLDLVGPSTTRTVTREAGAVVHIRYGATSGAPWAGVAPWQAAEVSASLLANLEGRLRQESRGRVGYILPVPVDPKDDDDDADPLAGIKGTLKALKGELALVETLAGGYGDKASAPAEDWKPRRLGANPPRFAGTLA